MVIFFPDNDTVNYVGMLIWIDINGNKGPNVYGKDTFLLFFNSTSKKVLFRYSSTDRNYLLTNSSVGCNKDAAGYACGALIQLDGWELKEDYPW